MNLSGKNSKIMYVDVSIGHDIKEPFYYVDEKLDDVSKKQNVNIQYSKAYHLQNISIDILNDDCLRHIFTLLSLVDKIRIEKVCKRWRILSKQSWYKTKTINLLCPYIRAFVCNSTLSTFSKVELRPLLLKCGRYITNLNLSKSVQYEYDNILSEIIQFCPNLRSITISNDKNKIPTFTPKPEPIRQISHIHFCKSPRIPKIRGILGIRKIRGIDIPPYCPLKVDLNVLFGKYTNLESLSINDFNELSDETCYFPTQTLHTLKLNSCTINDINFSKILRELKNLKHLAIEKCKGIYKGTIEAINTYCTNLRVLEISFSYSTRRLPMLSFTYLSNLQILKISSNDLLDIHIADMTSHCQQLTCISIAGSDSVTDIGLAAIATLLNLEKLCVEYLANITDDGLCKIHNLKELKCVECPFITDGGIRTIIESSPQLELLNIFHCRNITDGHLKTIKQIFPRIILKSDQ